MFSDNTVKKVNNRTILKDIVAELDHRYGTEVVQEILKATKSVFLRHLLYTPNARIDFMDIISLSVTREETDNVMLIEKSGSNMVTRVKARIKPSVVRYIKHKIKTSLIDDTGSIDIDNENVDIEEI